ncbi:hypothetical protein Bbelb_074560 [Branchiostoma belcheri]|nr:hypothetical protein Bbelb_074560 [Branchiostoma belcheri]
MRLFYSDPVKTELQDKPEPENGKIYVSHGKQPGAPSADSGKDSSPPSAAGDNAVVSAESSTSSAFDLPASNPDTADKRPAVGEGDVTERHSLSIVHGKEMEAPDNNGKDACNQTTTFSLGEGSSLTATSPSPKHKDAEDPQYKEVMSSVDQLCAELRLERDYAETPLAHSESLRAKLTTTAPKVLKYPVLKNVAVPDRTSYELPDTQARTEQMKSNARATYVKRWYRYWEELVRMDLKEAPQVFGPED